jgi:alpha-beta hydrolase superfamily lysophospholipase
MTVETKLSTFVASDGDNIVIQDWPLADSVPMRGVVVVVHGLGEHAGRYDHVARQLNEWGYAVRGYDQCGHGESGGARGSLPTDNRLLDDLMDIVDSTRIRMPRGVPLILLGHSLGGLVTAQFVALNLRQVDGLVLSSPVLNPGLSKFQQWLLGFVPRLLPNLRMGNGLNPQYLSHDLTVVACYTADRRVHNRISARLVRFIAHTGPQVLARAAQWKVPTLLMYAGDDHLANPQGSRDFAAAAPPAVVQTQCFDTLYHEIFNEVDTTPVFATLKGWLDKNPWRARR